MKKMDCFLRNFQSISLHALKLALNKSMCESDNKQSINKLPPKRTEENRNNYAKQRNLCVTLLKKSKREFHGNLNP